METVKTAVGITIFIVCMLIFVMIGCAKIFRISKPVFFLENVAEIAILTFVSMLMGILLILS